jgi:hypothetical protein
MSTVGLRLGPGVIHHHERRQQPGCARIQMPARSPDQPIRARHPARHGRIPASRLKTEQPWSGASPRFERKARSPVLLRDTEQTRDGLQRPCTHHDVDPGVVGWPIRRSREARTLPLAVGQIACLRNHLGYLLIQLIAVDESSGRRAVTFRHEVRGTPLMVAQSSQIQRGRHRPGSPPTPTAAR